MRGTFGGRSLFPPPVLRERAREGGFQRQTYLLKCCDAAGTTACFPHRHEPFALERRPATCDASHVCRASAQCRRTADPPVKTHAPLPNLPRRTACHYPQVEITRPILPPPLRPCHYPQVQITRPFLPPQVLRGRVGRGVFERTSSIKQLWVMTSGTPGEASGIGDCPRAGREGGFERPSSIKELWVMTMAYRRRENRPAQSIMHP
jgi:hypothetical protein